MLYLYRSLKEALKYPKLPTCRFPVASGFRRAEAFLQWHLWGALQLEADAPGEGANPGFRGLFSSRAPFWGLLKRDLSS